MAKNISQVVESVDEKLGILFGDLAEKFDAILEKHSCKKQEVEESESESPDGTGFDTDAKKVSVKATAFGDKPGANKKSKAKDAGFDGSKGTSAETYDKADKVSGKDQNPSKPGVKTVVECDQKSDEEYVAVAPGKGKKGPDKNPSKPGTKKVVGEGEEECENDEDKSDAEVEGDEEKSDAEVEDEPKGGKIAKFLAAVSKKGDAVKESNNNGYGSDGQKDGDNLTADEFEGNLVKGKPAGFKKDTKPAKSGDDTPKDPKASNAKTGDLGSKGKKGDETPKNPKESNKKTGPDLASAKGGEKADTPKDPKASHAKIVAKEGVASEKDIAALVSKIAEKLKKCKKPSDVMPIFKDIVKQFEQDKVLSEKQIYTLRAIDKQLV